MKILMHILVITLLHIPLSGICQAVEIFDVTIGGRTVGLVKVLHFVSGQEIEKRKIEAEFSIPFYSGSFFSENQFLNGVLKTSLTEHRVNGKTKEQTRTRENASRRYDIDFYETTSKIKKSKDLKTGISSTITSLYYEEPLNIYSVYSERYGQMCSVKKLEENIYAVMLPNGKQSIYSYSGGKCNEVQADLAGFKIRILKRNIRLAER